MEVLIFTSATLFLEVIKLENKNGFARRRGPSVPELLSGRETLRARVLHVAVEYRVGSHFYYLQFGSKFHSPS